MRSFEDIAYQSAETIRDGSLRMEDSDPRPRVDRSSWEPLAEINEMGYITYSSQDAIDSITGRKGRDERAYIEGFMIPEEARVFAEKINMFTDKVAWVHGRQKPSLTMEQRVLIPQVIVTRDPVKDEYERGMSLHANSTQWRINYLKKKLNIPRRMRVSLVSVFDPQWGRPATSHNGLFHDVFKALTPKKFKWRRGYNY